MTGSNFVARCLRKTVRAMPIGLRRAIKKSIPVSMKRRLWRKVVQLNPEGGTFLCDDGRTFEHTTDGVFARVLLEGEYEPELSRIARSALREGDVAIDAGANFGWYTTLFAQAVGETGVVYAFEPVRSTYERLCRNVELNGMEAIVSAHNIALGSEKGWVSMSEEDESAFAFATHSAQGLGAVPLERVDAIVENAVSKVALLKIDVEGFEHEIIDGAQKLLTSEHPPILQIEVFEGALRRSGSSRDLLLTRLANLGYQTFEVGKRLQLQPASPDATDIFARPPCGKFQDRLPIITA